MLDADRFTVTVRCAIERTDIDPTLTLPAHSLTVSPEGHLNIHGQLQSRSFLPRGWESLEVKRISLRGR